MESAATQEPTVVTPEKATSKPPQHEIAIMAPHLSASGQPKDLIPEIPPRGPRNAAQMAVESEGNLALAALTIESVTTLVS